MEVIISLQCRNFIIAVILGGIMALVYDFLRVIKLVLPQRDGIKIKKILFSLADILYFIVFSVITFVTLFYINSGEIRFYIFCGMFFGTVIFHYTAGNFIYRKMRKFVFKFKASVKAAVNKIKKFQKFRKKTMKIKSNDI